MPPARVRADHHSLSQVAQSFNKTADTNQKLVQQLKSKLDTLRGGDWIGKGADTFYAEMDSQILPSLQRLIKALHNSARVTTKISQLMQQADEDVGRLFKGGLDGSGAAGGGAGSAQAAPAPAIGEFAGSGEGESAPNLTNSWDVSAAETAEVGGVVGRMFGDFEPRVQVLISQSPTLTSQIEQLEADGYTVEVGEADKGSYHNRASKKIVIEGDRAPERIVQSIAHEVGHGIYGEPPYHPPDGTLTRDEYIDLNVREDLRNEGFAQFNSAKVRTEILDVGGPDIGVPGTAQGYMDSYQAYQNGGLTYQQTIERNADLMGEETTSTNDLNYKVYYGESYADLWNESLLDSEGGAE